MIKALYILAIITLSLFLTILINYEKPTFVSFDNALSNALFENDFIIAFHFLGSTSTIIPVALILLFLLWFKKRNYWGMLFVLITIGIGRVLNQVIRNWVDRPRPELVKNLDTSFSFPSGHAMIGLLFLFTIAYLVTEVLKGNKAKVIIWTVALVLTILTGLSRIAESYHFATDVIAGWCIGYTWFVICMIWYNRKKNPYLEY